MGPQSTPQSPQQAGTREPRPRLAEFLAEAERLRDKALAVLKRDGHHESLLVGWRPDGTPELIRFDLRTDGPSLGTVLAATVRRRGLRCFVSIAEAWMTRGPAVSLVVPPSASPEREQVLVIGAIHPERKQLWCYPFAAEGGTVVIGKALSTEGTTLGGDISNALGTEGPP